MVTGGVTFRETCPEDSLPQDPQNLIPVSRAIPASVAVAGGDVEVPVGAHDHVAEAAQLVAEIDLVVGHAAAGIESDALEVTRPEYPDQQAALPLRDSVSGVDGCASRRRRIGPGDRRRNHARTTLTPVDGRPAQVVACPRHVDLVVVSA